MRLSGLLLIVATLLPGADMGAEPARAEPPPAAAENEKPSGDVALPPELFSSVSDLTSGFPGAEREAYYKILARARDLDVGAMRAAAKATRAQAERDFRADSKNARRQFSLFYEIIRDPGRFRGKLVTLHGYIQRLETMSAGENDEGLETLHQAYLFTADSVQNPWVVVCSEVPDGIPQPRKGSPTNDVSVTGYFFKLWAYDAQRGRWAAPLILAQRLEWHPAAQPLGSRTSFRLALGATMVLGILALAGLLVLQRRRDRMRRAARAQRLAEVPPEELDALRDLDGGS